MSIESAGGGAALAVAGGMIAALVVSAPFVVQRMSPESTAGIADAETIGTNRLGAATVEMALRSIDSSLPASDQVVFSAAGLAPGDQASGSLTIGNTGDLPIDYVLALQSGEGLLADWLQFEIWDADGPCDPANPDPDSVQTLALETIVAPDLTEGSTTTAVASDFARPDASMPGVAVPGADRLPPGVAAELCVGATLPLDAPNEVQGTDLDVTIVITARQTADEGG